MPTLEDTEVSVPTLCQYSGRVNHSIQVDRYYRRNLKVGTGSRVKPKTPDETPYKRKIYNGVYPYGSGTETVPNFPSQNLSWSGGHPTFGYSVWGPATQGNPEVFDPNLLDLANLKALRGFNQRDMDLGTAWKERGKTASLVADSAHILVNALRAIKRRNGRELLDALGLNHDGARLRGVVDTNLAWHYGAKPLMQDIAGATAALARLPSSAWTVQCEGKMADVNTKETLIGASVFAPVLATSNYRQSARVKITATQRPLTREQDLLWALGLDNLLGTFYETTPYSFVLDWLLPIGDWLQALNSIKYYTGWESVLSQYYREDLTFKGATITTPDINKVVCSTSVQGHFSWFHLDRRVVSGPPLLGLPIKDPKSIDHMAKALSLLAGNMAHRGNLPPVIRY